ncbi:Transposon Tf2-9 polyprotein [Nosema granulosis]|uniref:Transposon Tf2-9 polyprotein n=1 Tax=Nosema granulosis TaxID=83296 RepID=A0A9P6GYK2_9MICR|nr:Transposon Tf2-9 polyprotein [Nosema granulosis]
MQHLHFQKQKKNGDIGLLIDYRALNKKTIKQGYPFPSIQNSLTEPKGSTIFSQLDLNMGYYQIEIDKESVAKTAFVLPFGQYEFFRMPFGLSNASREFQRIMNEKLSDLNFVKVFVDDILIYSQTPEEHLEHINAVLSRLSNEGISINFEKSSFMKSEVKYLGKIINSTGIKPDISTIFKIENDLNPRNRKQLMKLIGVLNWFMDHIPNLSTRIATITSKLSINIPFSWDKKDEKIVQNIIITIKDQIILHHPDITKEFVLATDASDLGAGADLYQNEKIVGIYSYKFHKAELNYTVTEKELLAITKALKHFRPMILGAKITIKTNHKNLLYITNCETNRAQRWKMLIDEYNAELEHVEGKSNTGDSLSRCFFVTTNSTQETLVDLKTIEKLTRELKQNNEDQRKEELREKKIGKYTVLVDKRDRIAIPENYEETFLRKMHEDLAHPGVNRFAQTLTRPFLIQKLYKKIKEITKTCTQC